MIGGIIATRLNKSFGTFEVLKDITLRLNPGQVTILFGPSGCGKTTLLRNLSLLDLPDSGELEIFDKYYQFPVKSRKSIPLPFPRLTVVFQQLFLWPNMTNRENIMLAFDPTQKDFEDRLAYLEYLIKEMDMKGYIDNYPNQSSLGQKQRVAIARALILNPDFIFFDEITASLDILQTNHILEMITALRSNRMGFLLITHDIEIARKVGDQLIFMQDGRIAESGDRAILKKPATNELNHFLNLF